MSKKSKEKAVKKIKALLQKYLSHESRAGSVDPVQVLLWIELIIKVIDLIKKSDLTTEEVVDALENTADSREISEWRNVLAAAGKLIKTIFGK